MSDVWPIFALSQTESGYNPLVKPIFRGQNLCVDLTNWIYCNSTICLTPLEPRQTIPLRVLSECNFNFPSQYFLQPFYEGYMVRAIIISLTEKGRFGPVPLCQRFQFWVFFVRNWILAKNRIFCASSPRPLSRPGRSEFSYVSGQPIKYQNTGLMDLG